MFDRFKYRQEVNRYNPSRPCGPLLISQILELLESEVWECNSIRKFFISSRLKHLQRKQLLQGCTRELSPQSVLESAWCGYNRPTCHSVQVDQKPRRKEPTWVDKWCFSTKDKRTFTEVISVFSVSQTATMHQKTCHPSMFLQGGCMNMEVCPMCGLGSLSHCLEAAPHPPFLSLSGSWQIVGGANGKAPAPVPLVHRTNVKAPSMLQLRVAMTRPPCHSPPVSELMGRPQARKTDGGKAKCWEGQSSQKAPVTRPQIRRRLGTIFTGNRLELQQTHVMCLFIQTLLKHSPISYHYYYWLYS